MWVRFFTSVMGYVGPHVGLSLETVVHFFELMCVCVHVCMCVYGGGAVFQVPCASTAGRGERVASSLYQTKGFQGWDQARNWTKNLTTDKPTRQISSLVVQICV